MKAAWRIWLVVAAVALMAAGCAGRSRIDAEDLSPEYKAAYQVRPGMSRDRVEGVYGMPTDIGLTKEGHALAHYRFGTAIRSVVYDERDRVVVAYP